MVEGGGGGGMAGSGVATDGGLAADGAGSGGLASSGVVTVAGGVGGRRYGVRAAEVAMHRALSVIRVEVILLDDSPQVFEIQASYSSFDLYWT